MNLTARALRQPTRHLWTLAPDEALQLYAEYTSTQLQDGVSPSVLDSMNREAYRMGRLLRRLLLLRQSDIKQFVVALYRNIGIRLDGHLPSQLCFHSCYFSHFYTPEVCLAASALDDGIMRGLLGTGRLTFQQRITEGCSHCLATYQ